MAYQTEYIVKSSLSAIQQLENTVLCSILLCNTCAVSILYSALRFSGRMTNSRDMPEFLHLNSGIENNMPKEIKTGHTDNGPEKKLTPFFISVPVKRQAHFTMVALFHESVEFVRDYTLPFNLLSVCIIIRCLLT